MAPVADLEKALAEGGKIEVLKKSGDTSSFTVASLGKPFDVDGEMMCYGYGPETEEEQKKRTSGSNPGATPAEEVPHSASDPMLDRQFSEHTPDPSEPLPDYQGGAEDEWGGS